MKITNMNLDFDYVSSTVPNIYMHCMIQLLKHGWLIAIFRACGSCICFSTLV